jgi:hypothetical protein
VVRSNLFRAHRHKCPWKRHMHQALRHLNALGSQHVSICMELRCIPGRTFGNARPPRRATFVIDDHGLPILEHEEQIDNPGPVPSIICRCRDRDFRVPYRIGLCCGNPRAELPTECHHNRWRYQISHTIGVQAVPGGLFAPGFVRAGQ